MKRKKSICKSLFTICLILGLAFVLPNIKPVPVIAASKASYEIINKKEIRKYKKLLDDDIISQDEFNAKKKELLGL